MIEIFRKGGPIMWPLLLLSVITLSVVLERLIFVLVEKRKRNPKTALKILESVEKGEVQSAIVTAENSSDFVAKILGYALKHHHNSMANAILGAANKELKRFSRGLAILDTSITLAPLLGLLGTVTGLIRSFRLLGAQELGAPTAITGGIAEALIATAFGLGIAIIALIPFNYLNSQLEEARHDIEDSTTHLELVFMRENNGVKP